MKQLTGLLSLTCVSTMCVSMASVPAMAGTLFCGAYPNWVLVIDEAQGKVVDKIHLDTGLPTSIRLSHDKKTIYVTTNDKSGVEVIDVATHKVTNHFVLNDATHKYRLQGGRPPIPRGNFSTPTRRRSRSSRIGIRSTRRSTRSSILLSRKSSRR